MSAYKLHTSTPILNHFQTIYNTNIINIMRLVISVFCLENYDRNDVWVCSVQMQVLKNYSLSLHVEVAVQSDGYNCVKYRDADVNYSNHYPL